MNFRNTTIISVVIACLSAMICATILVKPSILFRNEGSIKVKGSASETVQSDMATWKARVVASDATASGAFVKISESKKDILEFLKNSGIKEKDVEFKLDLSTIFKRDKGYATDEVIGYQYNLSMAFSSSNIGLIESVSSRASALVENGITIESYSPEYFYTKLEVLKLTLMSKAAQNAKERAKLLVSGSGSRLGRVVSASQGVFQITKPLSTETSDYGMYDTTSKEKQVNCVVTVEFSAER